MNSIWGEIKRRNVVKVAVAYAIVAWVLVQVVATVLPLFAAPDWIARVFTFFVVLGFPLAIVIAWAYELTPEGIERTGTVPASESITRSTGRKLNVVTASALTLALAFVAYNLLVDEPDSEIANAVTTARSSQPQSPAQDSVERQVRRSEMILGELTGLAADSGGITTDVALSPDGSRLVYTAVSPEDSVPRLYIRHLSQLDAEEISGTETARRPFFSPDGEWIGFDTDPDSTIQKVSVRGGLRKTLAEGMGEVFGATWSEDDTIVYATADGVFNSSGKLVKIPANGGTPEDILVSDGSYAYTWPQFLPGGQSLLFAMRGRQQLSRDGDIGLLSLDSGEYRTLIKGAYHPKYSPTGHIVFARNDTLWAVPFDAETNQITGDEAPLFDGVQHQSRLGAFAYDFSGDGLLVYLQGSDKYTGGSGSRAPLWLDRNGNEVRLNISLEQYWGARISPDGNQAAVVISDGENDDIWIIDLEREILSKLTFGAEFNGFPVWSPDGERIIYTSGDEEPGIYARAANGTGQPDLISKNDTAQYVDGISPDGEHLIVLSESSDNSDMYLLSLSGESFPQPFVTTPYDEDQAEISPNGNFVAYRSNETGRSEVYVRTFPDPDGGRWQVSADGGRAPLWSHDGKELFFRTLDTAGGGFNVVDVETQAGFSFDNRRLLFSGTFAGGASNYDVSANSERFLAFRNQAQLQENSQNTSADATLTIVENWFEELKQITPAEPAD